MGELVAELYMGLAQFFAGLFPERFKEAARTGPTWRRIIIALLVGFGSLMVGLVVAALALAAAFFVVALVIAIVRLF